jgi:hypothetical protein
MAERKKTLNATVGEDVYSGLKRAAEAERLSVSSLLNRLVYDWLVEHGHLKPAKARK